MIRKRKEINKWKRNEGEETVRDEKRNTNTSLFIYLFIYIRRTVHMANNAANKVYVFIFFLISWSISEWVSKNFINCLSLYGHRMLY